MHGQGAPSNISTKDKGLLPMKGQEPCYQNYFRNQVFFHFSIELIPILPTNAAREGALFAVVIYIKQHTSVNREAVRKASLKSTWFDKACAVGAKIVGEGVYRYRVYSWADGFIGPALSSWLWH